MKEKKTEEKLNLIQNAELNLAKKLSDICKINNLNLFMLGGAMLGAIRHKGFIPWDDDLDFGLMRDDYEKLYEILEKNEMGLKVISYKDKTTHDYPFKVIDPSVTLINKNHKVETKANAWIDVFPIDGMPNTRILRKLHEFSLLKNRALLKLSQLSTGVAIKNPNRSAFEKLVIFCGRVFRLDALLDENKRMKILDSDLKKCSVVKSNYLVNFMGAYKFKEMFPKEMYVDLADYLFEDTAFVGVKNYNKYLEQLYGNYLIPPAEQDKDKHKMEILN
ncbi:LicD family protein [Pediococcus stilesii]|uniref:LicD family protein n=1 Tax=Pediococcus stilesii TaxID=331679 RepID=A0A5R9BQD3_9LACO|nr:LicD family protein [Pediococcus stilesii]TLQ02817.1 LicD family protein [Pediococcus stilesii]